MSRYRRDFDFVALNELQNQAKQLAEYLKSLPHTISLNEAEADISNEGEEWPLISLSFQKGKIERCLKARSLNIGEAFEFDKEQDEIVQQALEIVDNAPQTGRTLDAEIDLFYADEHVREAIQDKLYHNQKLRHLVFLLMLKRRRDRLQELMGSPAPNCARGIRLWELWDPITKNSVVDGIVFMHNRILWAQGVKRRVSNEGKPKRFKCPHCRKEFTELNLAVHILMGAGLFFEFCHAWGGKAEVTDCPLCELPLAKEKLAKGEYDASWFSSWF